MSRTRCSRVALDVVVVDTVFTLGFTTGLAGVKILGQAVMFVEMIGEAKGTTGKPEPSSSSGSNCSPTMLPWCSKTRSKMEKGLKFIIAHMQRFGLMAHAGTEGTRSKTVHVLSG